MYVVLACASGKARGENMANEALLLKSNFPAAEAANRLNSRGMALHFWPFDLVSKDLRKIVALACVHLLSPCPAALPHFV